LHWIINGARIPFEVKLHKWFYRTKPSAWKSG